MPKPSGLLRKRQSDINAWRQAEKDTTIQFMVDTMEITLNDPDVMGKGVLGEVRLEKVIRAWSKCYDEYYGALSKGPESDYIQEKLDQRLRRIFKKKKLPTFQERYPWIKEQKY